MDYCRLYALAFNNLNLLFSQPIKLVDQGVHSYARGKFKVYVENSHFGIPTLMRHKLYLSLRGTSSSQRLIRDD